MDAVQCIIQKPLLHDCPQVNLHKSCTGTDYSWFSINPISASAVCWMERRTRQTEKAQMTENPCCETNTNTSMQYWHVYKKTHVKSGPVQHTDWCTYLLYLLYRPHLCLWYEPVSGISCTSWLLSDFSDENSTHTAKMFSEPCLHDITFSTFSWWWIDNGIFFFNLQS